MIPGKRAQTAHRQIINMILAGHLRPGDALQETKLAERLGMSRTPVREAVRRIESEGLAEQKGRFLKLRRPTLDEIAEVFELRLALEPRGAAAAATTLPRQRVIDMEARIDGLIARGPVTDETGSAHEDFEHWDADDAFHGMLAQASGNRAIVQVVRTLRRRTCMFDHAQLPERFALGVREHLAVIDAIHRADTDGAAAAMRRHIENARDAILSRLHDTGSAP
ncbi:GntR family transcriptional regulator [Tranquillimonas rosea]|uniref:GntR family transcriptional regulator n=1 Tax=Tranquillimonas rosea TaxID=641238 RepID=UPI003BA92451